MPVIGAIIEIEDVAAILMRAPRSQPWSYEALARHWLRAQACLAGASWGQADQRALRLLEQAAEFAGLPPKRVLGWDANVYSYLGVACVPLRACANPLCDKPNLRAAQSRFCSSSCKFASMRRRLQRIKYPDRWLEAPPRTRKREMAND